MYVGLTEYLGRALRSRSLLLRQNRRSNKENLNIFLGIFKENPFIRCENEEGKTLRLQFTKMKNIVKVTKKILKYFKFLTS